jgi:hypothetical protein
MIFEETISEIYDEIVSILNVPIITTKSYDEFNLDLANMIFTYLDTKLGEFLMYHNAFLERIETGTPYFSENVKIIYRKNGRLEKLDLSTFLGIYLTQAKFRSYTINLILR